MGAHTKSVTNAEGSWSSPMLVESFVIGYTPAMAAPNNVNEPTYWGHREAAHCYRQDQQCKLQVCHFAFIFFLFLKIVLGSFSWFYVLKEVGGA